MKIHKTNIPDAYLVELDRQVDQRGGFTKLFDDAMFADLGLPTKFSQTAISYNRQAKTLRGMHLQVSPMAEAKLVHCQRGHLYDVIVDLRKESPTFCQWLSVELQGDRMVYIPEGCAHGFLTLEPDTEVLYHITAPYEPSCQRGYLWNDPTFGIEWPYEPLVISERDRAHPLFEGAS